MAYLFQTFKKVRDPQTGKEVCRLDGKGRKIPHDKWRFQYTDWRGRCITKTGYASKRETEQLAARIEQEQRDIRKGYREPPKNYTKYAGRALADFVAEYLAWGKSGGGHKGKPWAHYHHLERQRKLAFWQERLKLQTLADLEGILPKVEKVLREVQATGGRGGKGATGRTLHNYAENLGAFCQWLVEREYLKEHPLAKMRKYDHTPVTVRRMATMEEIGALLEVAPDFRRILYEVDFCCGLRANELRQLTPAHLDHERKGLKLEAAWTKNRTAGFQPLPTDIFSRLTAYAASGKAKRLYEANRAFKRSGEAIAIPENPLLYVPRHTSRPLSEDFKKAGIAKQTAEGILDFHAIRTGYINLVIATGCDVKTAQALARHSTAELTMNVYGRADDTKLRETVEKVGAMIAGAGKVKPQNEVTSDSTPTSEAEQSRQEGAASSECSEAQKQTRAEEEKGEERQTFRWSVGCAAGEAAADNPRIYPEAIKAEQLSCCPALTYVVGEIRAILYLS